jgi:hypothetical protein
MAKKRAGRAKAAFGPPGNLCIGYPDEGDMHVPTMMFVRGSTRPRGGHVTIVFAVLPGSPPGTMAPPQTSAPVGGDGSWTSPQVNLGAGANYSVTVTNDQAPNPSDSVDFST